MSTRCGCDGRAPARDLLDATGRGNMDRSIVQIAEAFSRHNFADAYPYLTDDVQWHLVGDRHLVGRDHVIDACEHSAEYLAGMTTTFTKFKFMTGDSSVVIDSEAEYVDDEGQSAVIASCDIYEFSDGRLAEITSYTVQLSGRA